MNVEFLQHTQHNSTDLSSLSGVSVKKTLFWHKNTRQITFSRIHYGSRCFSVVPANALEYSVASCPASSPALDARLKSVSTEYCPQHYSGVSMPKDKPPHTSPAANDNMSDGTINLTLHKFARLLGRQTARRVFNQQLLDTAANDNETLAVKSLTTEDKDIT